MATIYADGKEVEHVKPIRGERYLWFQHARSLLLLTIASVKRDGGVKLYWQEFLRLRGEHDPIEGMIEWTKAEWEASFLKLFTGVPTTAECGPDEEVCDVCQGRKFHFERDFDVVSCFRCTAGKMKKRKPEVPTHSQRSPMHPKVPHKR